MIKKQAMIDPSFCFFIDITNVSFCADRIGTVSLMKIKRFFNQTQESNARLK